MDLGLQGRTVIVTGASGGLGRHIARGFAAEGADVVLTYHRSASDAERIAKEIDGRTLVVRYELDDADAARSLAEAAIEWTGRIDVLVNNAVHWGSTEPSAERSFEAVPDADWLRVLRANTEGALRLSRVVAPLMRQRRWGRLVHISSNIAVDGMAGAEYYAAAKAALHGFSRSAAFALGRHGDILSNVVMPGLTRTDTNTAITEAVGEHYSARAPARPAARRRRGCRPCRLSGLGGQHRHHRAGDRGDRRSVTPISTSSADGRTDRGSGWPVPARPRPGTRTRPPRRLGCRLSARRAAPPPLPFVSQLLPGDLHVVDAGFDQAGRRGIGRLD